MPLLPALEELPLAFVARVAVRSRTSSLSSSSEPSFGGGITSRVGEPTRRRRRPPCTSSSSSSDFPGNAGTDASGDSPRSLRHLLPHCLYDLLFQQRFAVRLVRAIFLLHGGRTKPKSTVVSWMLHQHHHGGNAETAKKKRNGKNVTREVTSSGCTRRIRAVDSRLMTTDERWEFCFLRGFTFETVYCGLRQQRRSYLPAASNQRLPAAHQAQHQ